MHSHRKLSALKVFTWEVITRNITFKFFTSDKLFVWYVHFENIENTFIIHTNKFTYVEHTYSQWKFLREKFSKNENFTREVFTCLRIKFLNGVWLFIFEISCMYVYSLENVHMKNLFERNINVNIIQQTDLRCSCNEIIASKLTTCC